MAATSTEVQLVLARLGELIARVDELKANQGSNATNMVAQISENVKRDVLAALTAAKEKKKTAVGETKDGVSNAAPKKKTHPTLSALTEAAWTLDEKSTNDFDKRVKWFVAVMNKHHEYMTNLLGDALIKEVEASESYLGNMSTGKVDSNTKAKAFFKSIKPFLSKRNEQQWLEVSKKLVDAYNAEKAVYDANGLPQAKAEAPSSAEANAAAALAASGLSLTPPVTVHTSTTTPAAQLANA